MRVMWVDSALDLTVVNIRYASYGSGAYLDNSGTERVSAGLYMADSAGNGYIIPGMCELDCKAVVKSLYKEGVYDFSQGSYRDVNDNEYRDILVYPVED